MPYDPEWIDANLMDMVEFCKENSMPICAKALEEARRHCEWEIRKVRQINQIKLFEMLGK